MSVMAVCTGQTNKDSRRVRACVRVCLCLRVFVCVSAMQGKNSQKSAVHYIQYRDIHYQSNDTSLLQKSPIKESIEWDICLVTCISSDMYYLEGLQS